MMLSSTSSPAPHPILAREGWTIIGVLGIITLLVHFFIGFSLSWIGWALLIFCIQFFRDPPRIIPQIEGALICPADGKVIAIEQVQDPYLNRQALKVSVFMNVFNVHSNRIPFAGKIMKTWYFPGKFLNAALNKASLENERNALHIRTESGHDITCVQIAGLVARRILCYVGEGDTVSAGQRYGFIRFGSRIDLYLPIETQIDVQLGQAVYSGSIILGRLPFAHTTIEQPPISLHKES
jgi:phosphatidylserine decarboxylase